MATINALVKGGIASANLAETINGNTAAGTLAFNIFADLAEFKRRPISKRPRHAGSLAGTRPHGSRGFGLTLRALREARLRLIDPDAIVAVMVERYGVDRTTPYKRLRVGR